MGPHNFYKWLYFREYNYEMHKNATGWSTYVRKKCITFEELRFLLVCSTIFN